MWMDLLFLFVIFGIVSGAAVRDDPRLNVENNFDWWTDGQTQLKKAVKITPIEREAKNVILFIGDGMGMSTITAAMFFKAERHKTAIKDTKLSFQEFEHVALAKVYNTDSQAMDSASTASAILTGWKARLGTTGVTGRVARQDCQAVKDNKAISILKYAQQKGKRTGLVTTTRITHATPAAAYAHSSERYYEGSAPDGCTHDDIATQLVTHDGNNDINVLLGGGRRELMPENERDPEDGSKGKRKDGRNLIKEWSKIQKGKGLSETEYRVAMNKTEFDSVDPKTVSRLLGLFQPSHMHYEVDRGEDIWGEPSLVEMTEKAIKILQNEPKGYFLMVEGGRIDHGHHDNLAHKALEDTLALDDAVQKAVDLTSEDDTLIVVTADHSHPFSQSGDATLYRNILDVTDYQLAQDGKPYLILNYANGPSWYYHRTADGTLNTPMARRNITEDIDLRDKNFVQDALLPLKWDSHSAEDVSVHARGPMAHLFNGVQEQSYVAHVMMYASCLGPNKQHCANLAKQAEKPGNGAHCYSGKWGVVFGCIMTLLIIIR